MILLCKEGEAPPEVVVVLSWQFLQEYSELRQLLCQVFFPTRKLVLVEHARKPDQGTNG